jgi:hypothetical protein
MVCKEISNEGVMTFNSIYDAVVSICKISSKFFKEEPAIQQQFSFAKVTKTLGISKKAAAKKTVTLYSNKKTCHRGSFLFSILRI